jgi:hypothetical protein
MKQETKLESVFKLFLSTDRLRQVMLNPFTIDGKTFATDAPTMVFCDNSKIDFEFTNNEKPINANEIINETNISEIINTLTIMIFI